MVDPWMYISYFLDPFSQMRRFIGAYHGERIPVILPGFLIFKLFEPATAIFVLHLILYYVCIFSLFLFVKKIFNEKTALITTMLCSSYSMFLSSIGQTHADSFGIAYAFFAFFLIAKATQGQDWEKPMFFFGASIALFIFTNIAYAPFLMPFGWYLLKIQRNTQTKPLVPGLISCFCGAVITTFFLGIISKAFGGKFLFFSTSLNMAQGSWIRGCANPRAEWVLNAWWLLIPSLVFLISLIYLWILKNEKPKTPCLIKSILIGYCALCFILIISSVFNKVQYLQFSFYTSLVIPSMCIALGALLHRSVNIVSQKNYYISLFAIIISGLFCAYVLSYKIPNTKIYLSLSFLCFIFLALLFFNLKDKDFFPKICILLFCLINCLVGTKYYQFLSSWPLERTHVKAVDFIGKWEDDKKSFPINRSGAIRSVAEIFSFLNSLDKEKPIRIWYSVNEESGSIYTAVASTFLWDKRFVTPNFPSTFAFNRNWSLKNEERVVILGNSEFNIFDPLQTTLSQLNLQHNVVLKKSFLPETGLPITATVIDLKTIPNSVQ